MKYAVVRIKGHQYKVSDGQEFLIDRVDGEKIESEVLLLVDDKRVKLGKPVVKDAKIKLRILGEEKGKKIEVIKYKAKSRYRRKRGFRPFFTRLLVEKISL